MTYAVARGNLGWVGVIEKNQNVPSAVAVFKITHPYRADCSIEVGIGDPSTTTRKKIFLGEINGGFVGGDLPYPNNKIVMDITELLPILNEDVYIKVSDSYTNSATGSLDFFEVEFYYDYESAPIAIYTAEGLPVDTVNGYSKVVTIPVTETYTVSKSLGSINLSKMTKKMTIEDKLSLKAMQKNIIDDKGVKDKDGKLHGTGLKALSDKQIEKLYSEKKMGILDTNKILTYLGDTSVGSATQIDHSASSYFPPVGDQGQQGSCASWATTYYAATFYEAVKNNWDLSNAVWETGGAPGAPTYQDMIMSPAFTYPLVNDGGDNGSSLYGNNAVLTSIGCSTWNYAPYDENNATDWPSEEAWREAAKHRAQVYSGYVYYGFNINSDADVLALKSLIENEYIVTIAVDANQYIKFTANDVWYTKNYRLRIVNHANTIVGFDDSILP